MVRYLLLAVAGIIMASPACANEFPIGRVEANIGWDHVRGKLSYKDSVVPANDLSDSRSTDGVVFGATVGADFPVAGYYLGVEASADLASNKKCEPILGNDSACFKVKRNFAIGGRAGAPLGKRALAYVGLAYVNGRATVGYTDNLVPTNDFSASDSRDGYRISGGVEYRVKGNMYAKLEYRYSDYGAYKYAAGTESVSIGFTRHQMVGGIGVRF